MTEVGISSIAGYLPRLRLSKKTVAQANSWIAPNLMGKGKGTRADSYTHLTLPTILLV